MKKKQLEKQCFDLTVQFIENNVSIKSKKYIKSICPVSSQYIQDETPDFVINSATCSYLIEHFMIDYCNDGINNNQSQSRRAERDIHDIYLHYHDDEIGTVRDENISNALSDLEKEMNKIVNFSSDFDYLKYVDACKRTFYKHYNNISEYKHNLNAINGNLKMGFLIEFHNDTTLIEGMYNGSIVQFSGKQKMFPMTSDIVNLFSQANDLDFIIVSQFNMGVLTEARDVRIYEPKNMEKSIKTQRIRVYDSVFFPKIEKNIRFKLEEK